MPRSQWTTSRLNVVGIDEAAKILGVDRRTVARWCEPDSGDYGEARTFMPPPARVGSTSLWTRRDIERFATVRHEKTKTRRQLQAQVRSQLTLQRSSPAIAFIAWNDELVATLAAARDDGTGGWSVQPTPAPHLSPTLTYPVAGDGSQARKAALTLVAKRLTENLAAGLDPRAPGGFLNPPTETDHDDLPPDIHHK